MLEHSKTKVTTKKAGEGGRNAKYTQPEQFYIHFSDRVFIEKEEKLNEEIGGEFFMLET